MFFIGFYFFGNWASPTRYCKYLLNLSNLSHAKTSYSRLLLRNMFMLFTVFSYHFIHFIKVITFAWKIWSEFINGELFPVFSFCFCLSSCLHEPKSLQLHHWRWLFVILYERLSTWLTAACWAAVNKEAEIWINTGKVILGVVTWPHHHRLLARHLWILELFIAGCLFAWLYSCVHAFLMCSYVVLELRTS